MLARTYALSQPLRTSTSFGTERKLRSVASQLIASASDVFPCALSPTTAVTPSLSSITACSYTRKFVSSMRWMTTRCPAYRRCGINTYR